MKIEGKLKINAKVEDVWHIVAHEFANIGEWASHIQQSSVNHSAIIPEDASVGGRICYVNGFDRIQESFSDYDETQHTYTYEANGLPFFITHAQNRWDVTAIDDHTTQVQFSAELRLMPLIGWILAIPMRIQLNRTITETIEELKYYAETGIVHPRKAQSAYKVVARA